VLLDVEDLVPERNTRLKPVLRAGPQIDQAEDFERFLGSLVKVQTFEPVRNTGTGRDG